MLSQSGTCIENLLYRFAASAASDLTGSGSGPADPSTTTPETDLRETGPDPGPWASRIRTEPSVPGPSAWKLPARSRTEPRWPGFRKSWLSTTPRSTRFRRCHSGRFWPPTKRISSPGKRTKRWCLVLLKQPRLELWTLPFPGHWVLLWAPFKDCFECVSYQLKSTALDYLSVFAPLSLG